MSHPLVVHCKKAPYDVYCGRPSQYGNPFEIGKDGNRKQVIAKFKEYWNGNLELREKARKELKGKILGCWCAPEDCHCDIIAESVNKEINHD